MYYSSSTLPRPSLFSLSLQVLLTIDLTHGFNIDRRQGGVVTSSDPGDLSYIDKWAAIGDSYAAGIGAGNRIDFACSRYDGGYPEMINSDDSLGDPTLRTFTNLACSGALTPAIIKQANTLPVGQRVITISAGGNDAGLSKLLDACVFTFSGWFASECADLVASTTAYVNGPVFAQALDTTIKAAQAKLSTDGMIFYTGYAQFFDATTNECDTVTWNTWYNIISSPVYLTQANRNQLNQLAIDVNNALEAACTRGGANVFFVDYDDYYGQVEGRYCEPGVDESSKASGNRPGLLFNEFNTDEAAWGLATYQSANGFDKRELPASGSFSQGESAEFAAARNFSDPEHFVRQGEYFDQQIQKVMEANPDAKLNSTIVSDDMITHYHGNQTLGRRFTIIPDDLNMVFHPLQEGQAMIANLVVYHMSKARAQMVAPSFAYPTENTTWDEDATCVLAGNTPGAKPRSLFTRDILSW